MSSIILQSYLGCHQSLTHHAIDFPYIIFVVLNLLDFPFSAVVLHHAFSISTDILREIFTNTMTGDRQRVQTPTFCAALVFVGVFYCTVSRQYFKLKCSEGFLSSSLSHHETIWGLTTSEKHSSGFCFWLKWFETRYSCLGISCPSCFYCVQSELSEMCTSCEAFVSNMVTIATDVNMDQKMSVCLYVCLSVCLFVVYLSVNTGLLHWFNGAKSCSTNYIYWNNFL